MEPLLGIFSLCLSTWSNAVFDARFSGLSRNAQAQKRRAGSYGLGGRLLDCGDDVAAEDEPSDRNAHFFRSRFDDPGV